MKKINFELKKFFIVMIILYCFLSFVLFKITILEFNRLSFDFLNDNFICMKDGMFYPSNLVKSILKRDFGMFKYETRKIIVNNYIFIDDILKVIDRKLLY